MNGLVKRKQHCLELCGILSDFQQTGSLCDIAITTDNDEVVFAHKTVLAASSSYFLGATRQESNDDGYQGGSKIDLSRVSKDTVQQAITYIYTGQLLLSEENVTDILSVFEQWKLTSGIALCQKFNEQYYPAAVTPKKESLINGRSFRERKCTTSSSIKPDDGDPDEEEPSEQEASDDFIDTIKEEILDDDYDDDDGDNYEPPSKVVIRSKPKILRRKRGRPKKKGITVKGTAKKRICPYCNDIFYSLKDVREHKKTCELKDSETNFTRTCDICHNTFDTPNEGAKHCSLCKILSEDGMEIADAHGSKGSAAMTAERKKRMHKKCHRCHQAFDTPDELLLHKEDCRPTKIGRPHNVRRCRKCKISFETPEICSAHQAKCKIYVPKPIPENFKFKCDRCSHSFVKRRTLRLHILRNHWELGMEGPEYYFCKVEGCSFKTMYQYYMRKHQNMTHSPGKPAMCDICGSMSKNDHYLKAHKKMCHSEEVPCDMCSLTLRSEQGLRMHKRRVHGFGQPTKLCTMCTYTTYTKSELDRHMFQKHDIPMPSGRMERCPFCDHKTLTKAAMDDHVLRHTADERKYPCLKCKKSFVTDKDLRAHLQVHNPERKRFKCPYCEYSTPYGKFKLGIHIDTMHEKKDYKPWVCDICSYRTNIKGNLTLHLRNTHKLSVSTKTRTIHKLPPILPSQFRNNSNTKPPAKGKERHRLAQRPELEQAVQDLETQCHNQQAYEMMGADRQGMGHHPPDGRPTYTKLDSNTNREGRGYQDMHHQHASILQPVVTTDSSMLGLPSAPAAHSAHNMTSAGMLHHGGGHAESTATLAFGVPSGRLPHQTDDPPPPSMYMDTLISSLVPRNDQQL